LVQVSQVQPLTFFQPGKLGANILAVFRVFFFAFARREFLSQGSHALGFYGHADLPFETRKQAWARPKQ
jgi:hypothetical protein